MNALWSGMLTGTVDDPRFWKSLYSINKGGTPHYVGYTTVRNSVGTPHYVGYTTVRISVGTPHYVSQQVHHTA